MPYSNTQHPSNTRTTVTIVLSIIFGISIIPTTALGTDIPAGEKKALVFTMENANVITLYQEVKVKILKGTTTVTGEANGFTVADTFDDTDEVYFIKTTEKCVASPATSGVTARKVTVAHDTSYAETTVIINKPEFELQQSYKMCYIKKGAVTDGTSVSTVYEALYIVSSVNKLVTLFTVNPSMFTAPVTTPPTVYAGQGPVTLTITANANSIGGAVNGEDNQHAYLIPCANDECLKDNIAQLCSSTTNKGALKTALVTGFGTATLKTTFTAPANPTTSYRICVPYCFKAGSCTSDTMSWVLVDSNPITFLPANPSSYTLLPTSPQARTWTEITFTGTDLKDGDKIRIVTQGQECSSASKLLPDDEYTQLAPPISSISATSSVFKFRLKGVLSESVTGKVCYSRAGNPDVWAPVYKSAVTTVAVQTKGDLVISPLQPTGFSSVVPKAPAIGQVLQMKFTGAGLAVGDTSYLVKCTTSDIILSDYCDDIERTTSKTKYECAITDSGDGFANCNANINPDVSKGEEILLCACYKKNGATDYALVDGSVTVLPKSPGGVPGESPSQPEGREKEGERRAESDITITSTDGGADGQAKIPDSHTTAAATAPTAVPPGQRSAAQPQGTVTKEETPAPHNTPAPKANAANDGQHDTSTDGKGTGKNTRGVQPQTQKDDDPKEKKGDSAGKKPATPADGTNTEGKADTPKSDGPTDKDSKAVTQTGNPKPKVLPKGSITVPPVPDVNKTTTLSATAISSTIPAVLITSVVFLYLYNW